MEMDREKFSFSNTELLVADGDGNDGDDDDGDDNDGDMYILRKQCSFIIQPYI